MDEDSHIFQRETLIDILISWNNTTKMLEITSFQKKWIYWILDLIQLDDYLQSRTTQFCRYEQEVSTQNIIRYTTFWTDKGKLFPFSTLTLLTKIALRSKNIHFQDQVAHTIRLSFISLQGCKTKKISVLEMEHCTRKSWTLTTSHYKVILSKV